MFFAKRHFSSKCTEMQVVKLFFKLILVANLSSDFRKSSLWDESSANFGPCPARGLRGVVWLMFLGKIDSASSCAYDVEYTTC